MQNPTGNETKKCERLEKDKEEREGRSRCFGRRAVRRWGWEWGQGLGWGCLGTDQGAGDGEIKASLGVQATCISRGEAGPAWASVPTQL